MERLTEKCWRNLDPWECCGQDKYCQRGCHDEGGCTNGCKVPKMYCELAKYEDLEEQCIAENQCGIRELLTKWKAFFDDITELYDYRKAEEQGLLLRLKARIRDNAYIIVGKDISKQKIGGIMVSNNKGIEYVTGRRVFHQIDIGKTVFLTREEAEAALAEKGGAE